MAQPFVPLARPLFLTARKSLPPNNPDCHYCQLKQKFSGVDQKCIEHTINDSRNSPIRQNDSPSEEQGEETPAEYIVGLLQDAEEALEEYWNNLYTHSRGSPQKAKSELSSIASAMRSLQDVFSRFPTQAPPSPTPPSVPRQQEERKLATRSQRFMTSNFSQLFEQSSLGEQIKQWVLHFQRILISGQVGEATLPMEEEIDMRIFKQSMERRFLGFAKNYQRYEQRTTEALQRLLFYMQQFGAEISQEQFKRDLQFLEEGQERPPAQEEHLHRYLLMQAFTIQHLLAEKELQAEAQLAASRRSRLAQLDFD